MVRAALTGGSFLIMTILGKIKQMQAVNEDRVIEDSLEEAAPLIADRQKDQMLQGKNAKGQTIRKYRSAAYAKKKNQMNPIAGYGNWDAKLTGSFYNEIFAEVRGSRLVISSTNEKTDKLVSMAGEELFGLNKPTKKEFVNDDLHPIFMRKIKKATGL